VDIKGAKLITIKTYGHEKTHYTAILACCADGTKLPLLLIFKQKTMPKDKIPHWMSIHVHSKGWMDKNEMKLLLEVEWAKHPALLVCEQFRAHITLATKRVIKELNMQLVVIP
jgi:hypothetical protein